MKSMNDHSQSSPLVSLGQAPQKARRLITKQMASERLSMSIRTLDRMVAEGLLEKVFVANHLDLRRAISMKSWKTVFSSGFLNKSKHPMPVLFGGQNKSFWDESRQE
ncbi:MAG: hypothetical protein HKP20_03315 [Akkermansiaceae bacterium]|nr:hypothetical protein [Akkermansiaceae bacterium]